MPRDLPGSRDLSGSWNWNARACDGVGGIKEPLGVFTLDDSGIDTTLEYRPSGTIFVRQCESVS